MGSGVHPHLSGRYAEGLGDLGVELSDIGESLDPAGGAAVRQLSAEHQARARAGGGLSGPRLAGRSAVHGARGPQRPAPSARDPRQQSRA